MCSRCPEHALALSPYTDGPEFTAIYIDDDRNRNSRNFASIGQDGPGICDHPDRRESCDDETQEQLAPIDVSAAIEKVELPDHALLQKYRESGAYTDCYRARIDGMVSHSDYIAAFYTSWLFKLERFILRWLASKPSTDDDVQRLVSEQQDDFAAWTVEARAKNQLLMCDFRERTRSWFMTVRDNDSEATFLYFGSAVVQVGTKQSGEPELGTSFNVLLGFHKLYSRALLSVARARLR